MVKNSVANFMLQIICRKKLAGWMETGWVGGWMDGWMDGWESGLKDCLQQSKINQIKNNYRCRRRTGVLRDYASLRQEHGHRIWTHERSHCRNSGKQSQTCCRYFPSLFSSLTPFPLYVGGLTSIKSLLSWPWE